MEPRVHRRMHDDKDEGLSEFLSRYSAAELATVTKVLSDLLHLPSTDGAVKVG